MRKKQLELNLDQGKHGGRRQRTGRKRIHSKGVTHRRREAINARTPLHINFKYKVQIRNKECLRILKRAIINARRMGLQVLHFSLQHNHVHLIIETTNNGSLTRGMRSLTITLAKGINKGKIQLGRYHLHVLRTIRETRNAVHYVLFNEQRHNGRRVDEFSSLISAPEAVSLIKSFVQAKRISLVVSRSDPFHLDDGRSFLFQRAWREFTSTAHSAT